VPTADPRLIRLVTARYRQMQGLATMADAYFPLVGGTALLLLSEEWHAAVLGLVLLALMVARFTWIRRRIDAYYAQRYGRVVQPTLPPGVAINLCMVISYAKIMRDVFHAPVVIQITVMTIGLCAYPLWVAVRDFPYRAYWLLVAGAGAASAVQLPFYQSRDLIYVWTRNTYLAIGSAVLAVGALDHRLLTRAPHAQRETLSEVPAEPS
jgi:hypothetical protein